MGWLFVLASLAATGGCIQAVAALEAAPLWLRGVTALLGVITLQFLRSCLRERKMSVHYGSAGFATTVEMSDLLQSAEHFLLPGSILLGRSGSKKVVLPLPSTSQHGVIVGGSGTGKSYSFFLPNVAATSHLSCVVTDPKSELWKFTSSVYRHATRFAPNEPEASACFNWIPLCRDARIAELCARAVVEAGNTERQEPPWPDLEAAFLAALFAHAATLSVPTPLTAYRLFTRLEPQKLLDAFLMSQSPVAREQAILFQQTNERMRGSIVPVVASKLQFLRDPRVQRFTSASLAAPDFGRLKTMAEAVYWCVLEQEMVRLRPLSSLFFSLLLEQLAAEKESTEASLPVNVYLDEFANVGVIPHFETTISLARGRGVRLWLGIQSLSQLETRYGKPAAQTILTNCATKMALSGLDVETAQYFSRSLGEKTQSSPRRTWQKRRFSLFATGTSDTVQEHSRSLMTPDEIRRLGTDEVLVITGNRRPMRIEKTDYAASPCAAVTTPLGEALTLPIEFATPSTAKSSSFSLPTPLPPEMSPERPKSMRPQQAALKFTARKSSHASRTWTNKPLS
jgi:type IV secretion system protein VirD4